LQKVSGGNFGSVRSAGVTPCPRVSERQNLVQRNGQTRKHGVGDWRELRKADAGALDLPFNPRKMPDKGGDHCRRAQPPLMTKRLVMLRHACVLLAAIFHCVNVHAQWSSFRPIDINVIPEDQRNMNEQTVVKGKIVPKEIRVDWYGFSLEGNTNEVKDLYQYPVADPTFARRDRIVRIRTKDVGTAEEIMRELRATPDKGMIPVTVLRIIDGQKKNIRLALHRANSLILKGILDKSLSTGPPLLGDGNYGAWGEIERISAQATATADNGELVYTGSIEVGRRELIPLEHFVLRGWKQNNPFVGKSLNIPRYREDPDHETHPMAVELMNGTGSTGIPKKVADGGAGFVFDSRKRFRVDPSRFSQFNYIVGVGKNESLTVDDKTLEVHVLVNME
jgi:hypothetical protein